jgi:hypothetical protein
VESDAKIEKYKRENPNQTNQGSELNSSSTTTRSSQTSSSQEVSSSMSLPPTEWDPVALHCGRLPVNESSSMRYSKFLNRTSVTLPHFLRSEQDISKYKETLREIAKLNGIK